MLSANLYLEHKVVLRVANPVDVVRVFDLVDSYADEALVDKARVKENLKNMIYSKGIILAEYENQIIGGVAGYALPCMFRDEMMFSVMFFYMKRGFRRLTRQVIKELELILLPTPNSSLCFGVMADQPKLGRFMRMMGYQALETHMFKRL